MKAAKREVPAAAPSSAAPEDSPRSLLDTILETTRPATPSPVRPQRTFVAECVDDRHPALMGRIRVRWTDDASGQVLERWVPTLHGMAVRVGDRLLLLEAHGVDEPIAVGVVDGFALRPVQARSPAAALALQTDETLRVTSIEGTPLVELFSSEAGPVIRLLATDVDIELSGRLRISARSLELAAREGPVTVSATDDVIVRGETIKLN